MKKMMAVLFTLMITLSGCSALNEKEEPKSTKETEPAVTAPVGHWMAAETADKYPYVIFLEKNGTGMAWGTTIGWMYKDGKVYIESSGLGAGRGEMDFYYEDGVMYLDGLPYVPWKLER